MTLTALGIATNVPVYLGATSVRFNTTAVLGRVTTYRRVWVTAALSTARVYGTYSSTLTVTSPFAPSTTPLTVDVALPAEISGNPTVTVTVPVGQTSGSVALTPTAQPNVNRTLALSFGSGNTQALLAWYETSIAPVYLTVAPLLPVSMSCNASALYFAQGFAVSCTLSIGALPGTGALTVSPVSSAFLAFDSGAQTFLGTAVAYTVTLRLDASFTDGASATIAFTISDSSFSFAAPPSASVTLRKVVSCSVSLVAPASGGYFVGTAGSPSVNAFLVEVLFAALPDTGVTITGNAAAAGSAGSGLAFNASTVTLTPASPSRRFVLQCWTTSPGTFTIQLPVSGSPTFATVSNTLSVTMNALLSLSLSADATLLYAGQNMSFQLALSAALTDGKQATATLAYLCGGAASPSSVTLTPPTATFSGSTFVVTGTVVAGTTPCAAGGTLQATLSGTSTTVDMTAVPAVDLLVLQRKRMSFVPTAPLTLYCGGLNSSGLAFQLSSLPSASFVALTVAADASAAGLLSWTSALLNFTKDSPSTTLQTTVRQVGPCASVPAAGLQITVTGTLALCGVTAEFDAATLASSFLLRLPLLNITAPTQLAQQRCSWATQRRSR